MTNYGWFWSLVHSLYTRAKFLVFSIPLLIILIVAYFLTPGFNQVSVSVHGIFAFIMGVGIFVLCMDGVWLVIYRRHLVLLDKTSRSLPDKCPFCGKDFHAKKTDRNLLFGFPGAQFDLSCSFCNTRLVSDYPFRYWVFTNVDTVLNSTFAWLYQGERLSREDLNLVLNKQHAESARAKLRASGNPDLERVWFDKPTARAITRLRTGPLQKLVSGNMSALSEVGPDILRTPPDVNTAFFKQPSDLVLRKKEKVILYVAPIRLATQRTNHGDKDFQTKDVGFFFITNQRVGFRGRKYRTNLSIKAIDDLDHEADQIAIRSHRRKTPDFYLDLDGELVYCVLLGLINTDEVS